MNAMQSFDYQKHFEQMEGRVNHLYLDSRGVVTVGIGCRVYDPVDVYLFNKSDHKPAELSDKRKDFQKVHSMRAGLAMSEYDEICDTYMAEVEVDRLFWEKLLGFLKDLNASGFPKLDEYPRLSQLALVDMTYTLGVHGLVTKFPEFVKAFKRRDWARCEAECERNGISESRNNWAASTFRSLVHPGE